ncbi:isopenicillin N synthase-like dioxygenase [Humitalea rosea]|uniref:Isopenicillin N synthase-like dioxygenase n=1 Tax=Humitalea rosea TaxID=990373 RepID=A0A2W7IDU5_9PROT|nr:2-oxoglutarate and iron-dependent oxygenase domain-containing protein [Humitalea rosea]PZW44901.1 isopenicillin N synthase-like dioxygenase [Humitalea rosea]
MSNDTMPRAATAEEMPILDLTPLNTGGSIDALARQLRHACETIGFFYIRNHGVPQAVVDAVFDATRRYFDLPLEERMRLKIDDRFRRGFMPQGINQHPGFAPDIKESYEFALDLPLDDPSVVAGLPLHGPNRWPEEHPWLREAAEAYFNETMALGKRLLRVFATSLDLPQDFFLQYTKKPMVQTRLFHYPPSPPVTDASAFGVAPHSDYGMITLLTQDPIGGLELRKRDGEWVRAPFVEGTFVVNLGDMFKVWTNDLYISNMHRVVNRSGKERYSIPTFFNLDYDAPVRALPQCLSPEHPARYEPIKSGDYLVSRFRAVQKFGRPVAELEAEAAIAKQH